VMVPHALRRDFCWFVLVWCLDFVNRDVWLACRFAGF
jgi:hypothetical protein